MQILKILIVLAVAFFGGCGGPRAIMDDEYIRVFQQHRDVIDRVAHEVSQSKLVCPKEPIICEPPNAKALARRFAEAIGLPIQEIWVDRRINDALVIVVATYGDLSISSSTYGYEFCKCELTPVVSDTHKETRNGDWYRPIGDGWTIFVAR